MNTPTEPTPLTDAATYPADCLGNALVVHRDCARSFENKLSAATTERDQLRAISPQICAALGNGAFCTPTVSVGFIESIPNEVQLVVAALTAERDRLRAEVERLTFYIATTIQPEEHAKVIQDLRDELTAEREKVRLLREALADAADSGELTGCWLRQARAALAATERAK